MMVGPTTTRSSNPRLMGEVLEAVKHLGEGRGSSAKEVLEILRRGKTAKTRNLAMQVQRALKNAVNAGLLQLRSGRYKILFSLKRKKNNRENESLKSVEKNDKKKEEIADLQTQDSMTLEQFDAGPKSRCSNCRKQKRRRSRSSNKRRRKRSSKKGRSPMKQASRATKDRKSRKLQRRGEEEVPRGGRSREKKISGSEVPERTGKSVNPDRNDEEEETEEMEGADNRSRSSSLDAEGKTMTRGTKRRPVPGGARKKVLKVSKTTRRRKSRKRRRSSSRVSYPAQDSGSGNKFRKEENNPKYIRMKFCDEEQRRDKEINRDDANDASDRHSVASN